MRFQFLGSRPPRINQAWVRMLIESANAPTGMHITEEPAEEPLEERVAS